MYQAGTVDSTSSDFDMFMNQPRIDTPHLRDFNSAVVVVVRTEKSCGSEAAIIKTACTISFEFTCFPLLLPFNH